MDEEGFAYRCISTAEVKKVGTADGAKEGQEDGHFERVVRIVRPLAVLHIALKDGRIVVELWTFVAHDILFFLPAVVGKSI